MADSVHGRDVGPRRKARAPEAVQDADSEVSHPADALEAVLEPNRLAVVFEPTLHPQLVRRFWAWAIPLAVATGMLGASPFLPTPLGIAAGIGVLALVLAAIPGGLIVGNLRLDVVLDGHSLKLTRAVWGRTLEHRVIGLHEIATIDAWNLHRRPWTLPPRGIRLVLLTGEELFLGAPLAPADSLRWLAEALRVARARAGDQSETEVAEDLVGLLHHERRARRQEGER